MTVDAFQGALSDQSAILIPNDPCAYGRGNCGTNLRLVEIMSIEEVDYVLEYLVA